MDIFKFTNPTNPTKVELGEFVNGLKSVMWVERYRTAGEFELVASADSDIRSVLPLGTLISHTETQEIMIVENHEITDDSGEETKIVITGSGFETILDQRIVGSNKILPVVGELTDYHLLAEYSWNQVVNLVRDHIYSANVVRPEDAIEFVEIISDRTETGGGIERFLPRASLYETVMQLLQIDDLGIKVVRPGFFSPLEPGSPNIALVVHQGYDLSKEVVFSYETGEIVNADYLWTNKKLKNSALVTGRWVETFVAGTAENYDRRMMYVDAGDIDGDFDVAPEGEDLTNVLALMQQRGVETLAYQNSIALTKAEANKDNVHSLYRFDYDLGDIVTVIGDYNETSTMRIDEYVEILDATGRSSYPTLTMVYEGE